MDRREWNKRPNYICIHTPNVFLFTLLTSRQETIFSTYFSSRLRASAIHPHLVKFSCWVRQYRLLSAAAADNWVTDLVVYYSASFLSSPNPYLVSELKKKQIFPRLARPIKRPRAVQRPTRSSFHLSGKFFLVRMIKSIEKLKVRIDQNLNRAEKSEALSEDVVKIESKISSLKQVSLVINVLRVSTSMI